MNGSVTPEVDWRLGIVLAILVLVGVVASRLGRLDVGRDTVVSSLRAALQLAVVALVITAALESLWGSALFAAVMLVVASWTAAGRMGVPRRGPEQVVLVGVALGAGALPVVALILGSGVIPFNGPGLVPTAGIIIGNTMTAAVLAGRRAFDELERSFGAYEAGLAIGLTSPVSSFEVLQPSAKEALSPGLDKTRTVGLVTLPGAFVGVLLGGGTPLEAGAAQLLVLVGLVAAQAITATVLLRQIAQARLVRSTLADRYPNG
ncbi:MAG: ABC transporter permease [Nocardioides sp.]|nr:ABC transporter permease [Nocardioides sp.]